MTRRSARAWAWAAAVLGAGAAAVSTALPPPAGAPAGAPAATDVTMAYHVHTTRSDGTGTREDVARAAARSGVRVVVLTDHGDGVRAAEPPEYIDGVLVIDGAEIGTWGGHYAAIGAAPAPYPLGGEPRAAAEDVRRLGGIGVAAHPGSSKDDLRWRDWDAPFDGIEWLNADSEWRDRPSRLWRTALAYPWRPVQALTALIDRPAFELRQWDLLTSRRPVVGLAAHDAHARLGLRGVGEPYGGWVALRVPAYETLFAAFANIVRTPDGLSGEAGADAGTLLRAIGAGRLYGVLTGIAPAGRVRFEAESGGRVAAMGEHLVPVGRVHLRLEADVPPGARTVLLCGGVEVAEAPGGRLAWASDGIPGACRAEVRVVWGGREVPWLVTNPVYVRAVLDAAPPPVVPAATVVRPIDAGAAVWAIERASDATAGVTPAAGTGGVAFAWRLGASAQTFAAVGLAAPADLGEFDSLVLRATADRPMRVWVQLRVPEGEGQRWGRSVYLDTTPRDVRVPFGTMLRLDTTGPARPPLERVTAILVVADTVHAAPGSEGRVEFSALGLAR